MLFLSSCKHYNYSISNLEKIDLPFDSVPSEVKNFFYKIKEIPIAEKYDFSATQLVNLDIAEEYQLETIPTKIGPSSWVNYYKLTDKTNNVSYRIDCGTPFPIIIFSRRLFIPQEYNILSNRDFEHTYFNCYYLHSGKSSIGATPLALIYNITYRHKL
jgi:hypothetical protein